MTVAFLVSSVLGSCCGCMVTVEWLAKKDPGSMNLMTFSTFLFIALEGLITESKFFTVKPKIPITGHLKVVIIFFVVNVINNQALNYHVPVPLHIIFRSGSLLANMVLGMWILGRRYSMQKYISIVLITIGIIVCTLATSAKQVDEAAHEDHKQVHFEWLVGITMLWFALFFSALLGIQQEKLFSRYGKHSKEALFYTHALGLPGFIIMGSDIYKHAVMFSQSEGIELPIIHTSVPVMWLWLLLCDLTQYFCIRSVYALTAECSSLTVTLVVTLRKFISLLISIIYFKNPFTLTHWVGTILVFGGTLMFADVFTQVKQALSPTPKREKAE